MLIVFQFGSFLPSFAAKVLGVFFCTLLLRSRVMPVQQGALTPELRAELEVWVLGGLGFGFSWALYLN